MGVGDYDALARTEEMMPDLPGLRRKSTDEKLVSLMCRSVDSLSE